MGRNRKFEFDPRPGARLTDARRVPNVNVLNIHPASRGPHGSRGQDRRRRQVRLDRGDGRRVLAVLADRLGDPVVPGMEWSNARLADGTSRTLVQCAAWNAAGPGRSGPRVVPRVARGGGGLAGAGVRATSRAPPSGNAAFDEYRAETLRRLEEEQREFVEYLERLRRPGTRPSSTSSWPSAAARRSSRTRPSRPDKHRKTPDDPTPPGQREGSSFALTQPSPAALRPAAPSARAGGRRTRWTWKCGTSWPLCSPMLASSR